MTRGNQRDTDRARAQQRAKGSASNSTIKGADDTANIMREKQRLAEEKKAAAAAGVQTEASRSAKQVDYMKEDQKKKEKK